MIILGFSIKVVDIVLTGMYCTGMYTGIETSMFRTSLKTGHVLAIPANFGQYKLVPSIPASTEKSFFFF